MNQPAEERLLVTLKVAELEDLIRNIVEAEVKNIKIPIEQSALDAMPDLISRMDVAKLFNVSTVTIDKWCRYNILPRKIKVCRRVYFDKSRIVELLTRKGYSHEKAYF
jgi:predicted DNA-binding transcriptional regulator AlpA